MIFYLNFAQTTVICYFNRQKSKRDGEADIEDEKTFLKILIHGKDTEKTKQTQQGALYLLRSTKSKLD